MEQEAQEAYENKRMRVIVQDNGPIHRCREVQALWTKWENMGLYMFFLPKYCSEMNPIELEPTFRTPNCHRSKKPLK
jgi:putative transposase